MKEMVQKTGEKNTTAKQFLVVDYEHSPASIRIFLVEVAPIRLVQSKHNR
jgi:hypothetical protein